MYTWLLFLFSHNSLREISQKWRSHGVIVTMHFNSSESTVTPWFTPHSLCWLKFITGRNLPLVINKISLKCWFKSIWFLPAIRRILFNLQVLVSALLQTSENYLHLHDITDLYLLWYDHSLIYLPLSDDPKIPMQTQREKLNNAIFQFVEKI